MYTRGDPTPRSVPLPPPPKAAPAAGPVLGNIGRSIGNIGAAVAPAVQTVARAPQPAMRSQAPAPVRGDIATSGGTVRDPYGMQRANAFKQTPQYGKAVLDVFQHQAPEQKAAIVQGAIRNPTPEGHLILSYVRSTDPALVSNFNAATHPQSDPLIQGLSAAGSAVGGAARTIYGAAYKPDFRANVLGGDTTRAQDLYQRGVDAVGGLIDKLPVAKGGFNSPPSTTFESGIASGEVTKNAAKDLLNMYAEALPSVAIPAEHLLTGQVGKAASDVAAPFAALASDPQGFAAKHPLFAAMMARGAVEGAARAGQGARTVATGKRPDIVPPSVHLTGNLTHERPNYSMYPLTRSLQKAREPNGDFQPLGSKFAKNAAGQVVPKTESQRGRLIRDAISHHIVGPAERVRRAGREMQVAAHAKMLTPGRIDRIVHAAKTATEYDPEKALIPGANVLSRIADGTVRRPGTLAQDLQKHLADVKGNRGKLSEPADLRAHDAYVKEIQAAIDNKKLASNPAPAFAAAREYSQQYGIFHGPHTLEARLLELGHYRDMSKEGLIRRALMPIVLNHMKGARLDPEAGLVRDVIDKESGKKITRPLPTNEMVRFAKAETGGHMPAYTSHVIKLGDPNSPFYVSSDRRPLPNSDARNTMYAYSHGLTDPSHNSMLEQRVKAQGLIDAHREQNRRADLLGVRPAPGQAWSSFQAAQRAARKLEGGLDKKGQPLYKPYRLGQAFHPADSLRTSLDKVDMTLLDEEGLKHAMSVSQRLEPTSDPGKYVLIHRVAADQLVKHEKAISPNLFWRSYGALNTQFRHTVLGTSTRHLPGVIQEQLIRDIASGVGIMSWKAGRDAFQRAAELDPISAREAKITLTGGMQSGQGRSIETKQLPRHFEGTRLEPFVNALDKAFRAPGLRQASTVWRSWLHVAIDGTKHILEETHQTAGVGKALLQEMGQMGRLQGEALDQAARGLLDPKKVRQIRANQERIFGRWTDMSPEAQTALLFSPFGMWWVNSAKFLARLGVDHPVKSAALASTTAGTEKERQAFGLDMFSPGHLAGYLQGGIPLGGKLFGQNYYSPFGLVNDPLQTAKDLALPWFATPLAALAGKNYLDNNIKSPGNPSGQAQNVSLGDKGRVIAGSLLSDFVPLYIKLQQITQGGSSPYDTSLAFDPQTKTPGKGVVKGIEKALNPVRVHDLAPSSAAPTGGSSKIDYSKAQIIGGGSAKGIDYSKARLIGG